MHAFSDCAQQSKHTNISINLKRRDGRQTHGSNNRYILKIHWKLKLKPSFVFICLFLSSVVFSSKRSLFSDGSIFLRARARHGENALWLVIFNLNSFPFMVKLNSRGACKQCPMIGQNYSNFFLLWLRSLRPRGLQITPFDWSELFKFVPLYGKADAICFQRPYHALSKTTMKDA